MKTRTRHSRLIPTLVMLAGTMAAAGSAQGVVLLWNNPAGGSAGIAGNWNPAQIPVANDILNFNLAAGYEVGIPASVPASSQHNYNFGEVSVVAFAPHAISGQLVVGLTPGSNANVSLTGSFTVGGVVAAGGHPSGTGTLVLADDNTLLTSTSGFGVRAGNTGTGTITIQNGARLAVTGAPVRVGALAGSAGSLLVSGGTPGGIRSEITITHPAAGDLIVGDGGNGQMAITGGGMVNVADQVLIATTAGVNGSLTVGSTTERTSALTAASMLAGGNALPGTAGGSGSLTVQPGAAITAGAVGVGDPDGGTGTLTLTGGLLTTAALDVNPATGSLAHHGGEIHVTGSYSHAPGTGAYFLPAFPASLQPAVLRFTGVTASLPGGFQIGSVPLGDGHLVIQGGSVVTTGNSGGTQRHTLAGDADATGAITITGAGSRLNLHASAAVLLGVLGDAALTMNGGLIDSFQPIRAATSAGSSCTITMTNGARVQTPSHIVLGGVINSAGGLCTATIGGSSTLQCGAFLLHPASHLTLDDAVLTAGPDALVNTVDLRGVVTLANSAEIAGDAVSITGTLQGSGSVYGDVTIVSGGVVEITGGGDLFIGSLSGSTSGFANLGSLIVGSGTAHILDGDSSPGGAISISGGSLFATGLDFAAGGGIEGRGSISASVNSAGASFTLQGSGLVFNGPVTADAATGWASIGGPRLVTFAAGGGFTGAGVIDVLVTSEEEAAIVATGDLSLGVDVNGAVVLNGPLHVGSHTVSVLSNTPAILGVETTLSGGTLVGPASNPRTVTINNPFGPDLVFTVLDSVPLVLPVSQVLEGAGVIDGQLRTSSGSRVTLAGSLTCKGSSAPTPPFGPLPAGNTHVVWMGDLDVGAHDLTFTAFPHRFEPESRVTIAGGSIHAEDLALRGELTGHGRLVASNGPVINLGHLHPGGTSVGELRFDGGFANGASALTLIGEGTIHADISGDQGFPCDRLIVEQGDAFVRGSLVVTMLDAEPPFNHPYTIIECFDGSVAGAFDSVSLPTLSHGTLEVRYLADRVQIVARPPCLADFNGDGNVDPDDLGDYINCFFSVPPCGLADFNGDGNVDPDDLGDFINIFFGAPC